MSAITEHPDLQEVEVLTLNCRDGLVPFYERYGFDVKDMTVELPNGTEEDYHVMVHS